MSSTPMSWEERLLASAFTTKSEAQRSVISLLYGATRFMGRCRVVLYSTAPLESPERSTCSRPAHDELTETTGSLSREVLLTLTWM
jgi:hypothetical protein